MRGIADEIHRMSSSSLANQEALYKPVVLLVWAAMTWVAVVYFGRGWPTSLLRALHITSQNEVVPGGSRTLLQHATEYLSVLPMLVAPPIVLLALFEFRHRYMFEDEMARAIAEEDLRDIDGYYGNGDDASANANQKENPRGFWVLEYDGRIIGAMGLDGRKPGAQLDSLADKTKVEGAPANGKSHDSSASSTAVADTSTERALRSRSKAAQQTAAAGVPADESALPAKVLHLRRFATSYTFRPSDIEDDMLDYVSAHAFASSDADSLVITLRPTIERGLASRLAKNGWKELTKGDEREAVSARMRAQEVRRSETGPGWKRIVGAIWPVSLEPKTYAIDRIAWESKAQAAS